MSMTPRQIELVQASFRTVQPMAATAAEIFYKRLFEVAPATRSLFKNDMKTQGQKLMQVLAMAVGSLSNLVTLVPIVQQLGVRHGGYGVKAEDYDSVRQALMWTLALVLQDAWTDELSSAWNTAYAMLAGVMKEAADGVP